jgi:hypothetical protein
VTAVVEEVMLGAPDRIDADPLSLVDLREQLVVESLLAAVDLRDVARQISDRRTRTSSLRESARS